MGRVSSGLSIGRNRRPRVSGGGLAVGMMRRAFGGVVDDSLHSTMGSGKEFSGGSVKLKT